MLVVGRQGRLRRTRRPPGRSRGRGTPSVVRELGVGRRPRLDSSSRSTSSSCGACGRRGPSRATDRTSSGAERRSRRCSRSSRSTASRRPGRRWGCCCSTGRSSSSRPCPSSGRRTTTAASIPTRSLDSLGASESSDPFHFGLSLARRIAECDGMELASHTFSHYFALEPGQTESSSPPTSTRPCERARASPAGRRASSSRGIR